METTLTLDDAVVRELREEAARRGTTLSALVEDGGQAHPRRTAHPEAGDERAVSAPDLEQWRGQGGRG